VHEHEALRCWQIPSVMCDVLTLIIHGGYANYPQYSFLSLQKMS
jgi:hypothetical protein